MGGQGLNLSCSAQGQMPRCFKHNYIPSGFIKCREFFDQLRSQ